ncbi:hypothetical protein YYG_02867 [Plasmodium vinckei petteri]|uniref:Uncharacterized protein n=1 Tax=Plasmodium vinckei petteri TaxID=138298 RepID=W7B2Z5_PLAVN|nr:hypothetical protein YYG_02867 [Plasmodium vinckei petteri]CAD2103280.1 conserved Plasmodium protein, unknown function [Plasmodium vinckei petteri]
MKNVVLRFVNTICKERDEIKLKRFYNLILQNKNIKYFNLNDIAYPISSICLFINFLEKKNTINYINNGHENCKSKYSDIHTISVKNNTCFKKKDFNKFQKKQCNNYENDESLSCSFPTTTTDNEIKIKNFIYFGKKYSISFFNEYLKYVLIRCRKEYKQNQILEKKVIKNCIIQNVKIENVNSFLHMFNAICVLQNGVYDKTGGALFRLTLKKVIQTIHLNNLENEKKEESEQNEKVKIVDSQTVVEVLTIMNKHRNVANQCFANSNLFNLFYFSLINYVMCKNFITINDSLLDNKRRAVLTSVSRICIPTNDIKKYYKKKIFLDIHNYIAILSFLKKYEYIFQIYNFQNFSDTKDDVVGYTWDSISSTKVKQRIYEKLIDIFFSVLKLDCKNQTTKHTSIIKLVTLFPQYFYKTLNNKSDININKIIIQNNWLIAKQINTLSYFLFRDNYINYFNLNIYNHISFFNTLKKCESCNNKTLIENQLSLYKHFFMFIFKYYIPFLYTNNIIYFLSTFTNQIKNCSKEEKKYIFTIINIINNEVIKRAQMYGITNIFPSVYQTNYTNFSDNYNEYIIKYDNYRKWINYTPNANIFYNNLTKDNQIFFHFFKIYKRHLFNICNAYSNLKFATNMFIKMVDNFIESNLESMNTKDITALIYYYNKINYKNNETLKSVMKYIQTNIYQYEIAQVHTILYGFFKLGTDLSTDLTTHTFTYLLMYIMAMDYIDTNSYNIYKKKFTNNLCTILTINETKCVQNFVKYISTFLNSYNYNDCIILQPTQDLLKVTIKEGPTFFISNSDIYKIIYFYKEMGKEEFFYENMEKIQHKKIDNIYNILNILNLLSKYKVKNNIILYDIFYLHILQKNKYNKFVKINDWINIIIGYSKLANYNPHYINKCIEHICDSTILSNCEDKNKINKKDILLLKYLYNHLKKIKLSNYTLIQNIISKWDLIE